MKTLIAVGKYGAKDKITGKIVAELDPLGVNSLDSYLKKEQMIKEAKKGFSPFTPIYEADMKFEPIMIKPDKEKLKKGMSKEAVYKEAVEKVYTELVDSGKYIPGVYGDCLKFVETEEGLLITEIGQKAFHKPNHASDFGLIMVSNDEEPQIFADYIIRKNEPGKGKAAFAGGFWNKGEGYVDSGLYTVLKEAGEELSFKCNDNLEKYRNDYNTKEIEVKVVIGSKSYDGVIKHAGTFKTSDALMKDGGERISEKSKKVRVDMTDLYLLVVKTDMKAAELEKELKIQYKAGDDAAKVMIENITPFVKNNDAKGLNNKLKGGIKHHETLNEVLVEYAHKIIYK